MIVDFRERALTNALKWYQRHAPGLYPALRAEVMAHVPPGRSLNLGQASGGNGDDPWWRQGLDFLRDTATTYLQTEIERRAARDAIDAEIERQRLAAELAAAQAAAAREQSSYFEQARQLARAGQGYVFDNPGVAVAALAAAVGLFVVATSKRR